MDRLLTRLRARARGMRKEPTRAENRLWKWLRDRRHSGFKFRRQVPIGPYIVDFYCPQLRLAIELDGSQHATAWMNDYDSLRTQRLQAHAIELLRIPNELLIRDSYLVEQQIDFAIEQARSRVAPTRECPSPPAGGEGAEGG
jgi:very-short-patch-repair endonuclease